MQVRLVEPIVTEKMVDLVAAPLDMTRMYQALVADTLVVVVVAMELVV